MKNMKKKHPKTNHPYFAPLAVLLAVTLLFSNLYGSFSVPSFGQSASSTHSVSHVRAKKKNWKVTVIGNSLLRLGDQTKYLKSIAKLYGTNLTINYQLIDGSTLHDHLTDVKRKQNGTRKALKTADIVIFQEYGTRYETTYKDITAMRKYMRSSARSYYYMTEFDDYNPFQTTQTGYLQKIKKSGVGIIEAESLIQALMTMGYAYKDLHMPGDYHPNTNNGYSCSILMYCQLFNKKCTDYPVNKCPKSYRSFLKGKNLTQKRKKLREILEQAENIRLQKGISIFAGEQH